MSTDYERGAEAMRRAVVDHLLARNDEIWDDLSDEIAWLLIPADPASAEGGRLTAVFKPCRVDFDPNMTQWAFEDVPSFARPAFPKLYHFIDEICAKEDGRLVGIQFWGPPQKVPGPRDAEIGALRTRISALVMGAAPEASPEAKEFRSAVERACDENLSHYKHEAREAQASVAALRQALATVERNLNANEYSTSMRIDFARAAIAQLRATEPPR